MYRCKICNTVFDCPHIVNDFYYHSEVDATEDLSYTVCPICHSEEYEEVGSCRICGKPLHNMDFEVCAVCSAEARKELSKFAKHTQDIGLLTACDDLLDGTSLEEFL